MVEFPLRLRITIDGPPVPVRSIGPGPLGAAAATATATPDRDDAGTSASTVDGPARVSDLVVLCAALAALLAGAMLAGAATRLTRAEPDQR